MNGHEHYAEAERLLELAESVDWQEGDPNRSNRAEYAMCVLAAAQVHATLALAATQTAGGEAPADGHSPVGAREVPPAPPAGPYSVVPGVAAAIDAHSGIGVNSSGCICGWKNPDGTDQAQLEHAAERVLAVPGVLRDGSATS